MAEEIFFAETRNYFIDEINHDNSMSKNHKIACTSLNYTKLLLILAFAVSECVSISVFLSSVGMPIDIASYAVEFKTCVIIAGIKIFISIIKKKRKKHDKKSIISAP